VDGQPLALFGEDAKPSVVVFMGTECPISNQYVPVLNELAAKHRDGGVRFFAVVSDSSLSRRAVAAYRDEAKLTFPVIFDASGALAESLKPKRTPEAFVLDRTGEVRYRGRIDDRFAAIGQKRQVIGSHDLADAIAALLDGKAPAAAETEAVGCQFEGTRKLGDAQQHDGITYARDIAPIVNANCVRCHRENDIAPFALTSYANVAKRANQIAEVTESGYMPPWKPVAGYGHFLDEQRLTAREKGLLAAWAKAGTPEGSAADLPGSPRFESSAIAGRTPDLILQIPEPFKIPAAGDDVYRSFVLPLNDLPDDSYVAAAQFLPDAKSVVHHSVFYLDGKGKARELDAADPGPGYSRFGGPGFRPSGTLGGWAPGAAPLPFPAGVGRVVKKNWDLVVQMHYHPDGRERTDQSSVAIYLQKAPIDKVVSTLAIGSINIDIPPGDANHKQAIAITLPVDITLIGAIPHMHLLGRDMKVRAITPDGSEIPLIWIQDWDFKWQGQYRYAEPITLKAGTTIEVVAHYDNTSNNPNNPRNPPQRVTNGEQTTDEMCFCFFDFVANSQQEIGAIHKAVGQAMVSANLAQKIKARIVGSAQ
jgi:thiol-disulfide isomerase/thioredoxin